MKLVHRLVFVAIWLSTVASLYYFESFYTEGNMKTTLRHIPGRLLLLKGVLS